MIPILNQALSLLASSSASSTYVQYASLPCPPLAGVGGGCRRDIIIDLEMEYLATLKDWPLMISLVDIVWGSFLTSVVSASGFFIVLFIERHM
ncbi:MAG: DUF2177 family protein, partial [Smithella sp.]